MALPARPSARRASLSAAAAVLLAGTVAALVVAGGPGSVAASSDGPATNSVTVSGLGTATGTPDVLRLDLGVQRTALNVADALNAANADIRRIKAALARYGVRDADVQTSQLSINQHYGPIQAVPNTMGPSLGSTAPAPPPDMGGPALGAPTMVAPDMPDLAPVPPPAPAPAPGAASSSIEGSAGKPLVSGDAVVGSTASGSGSASGASSGSASGSGGGATGVGRAEPAVSAVAPQPAPDLPAKDDPAVLGTREGMSSVAPSAGVASPGWVGYDGPNGYDVVQSLSVKLRDMSEAGAAISDAAEAGGDATRISGVSFDIEDNGDLLRQARNASFADAKAKAEQYARLAGRTLGRVASVNEGSTGGGPVPYPVAARDAAAGSVPIAAGSQQVSVSSTVVWELT